MTGPLAEILAFAQVWLGAGVAVFLRIGAAFLVLPAFGEAFIPARIRLGAALAFTVMLTPALAAEMAALPQGAMPPLRLFASETLAGLLIGIGLRLVVHGLQVAGSIAAQSTSLSQIAGGAMPEPQPAMGNILMLAGLTLAVMSGLHVHLAEAFLRSYEVLPLGLMPGRGDVGSWGIGRVAGAFSLAFSLAAPFLIASLLYNVALGVINKAMPQLMVAFVGAPAITFGGLVLLLVSMPFLLPIWMSAFGTALSDPMGGLR